jgi:hypothetical protein
LRQAFRFILTGGECQDVTQTQALFEDVYLGVVFADRADDSDGLIFNTVDQNAKIVILPKANRKAQREFDKQQYGNRNVVERFFC